MPMKSILFLKEIFLILMEPNHMQLSYKQKSFSGILFFFAVLKSILNLEHFEKKHDTNS